MEDKKNSTYAQINSAYNHTKITLDLLDQKWHIRTLT